MADDVSKPITMATWKSEREGRTFLYQAVRFPGNRYVVQAKLAGPSRPMEWTTLLDISDDTPDRVPITLTPKTLVALLGAAFKR